MLALHCNTPCFSIFVFDKGVSLTSCKGKGKGKGQLRARTGHEGPEGEHVYSCTLLSNLALNGVGGQRQDPAALPPGKNRYPLYRTLGGPQGRSGRVRNISPPPGFDPRTVQPVASFYADCDQFYSD